MEPPCIFFLHLSPFTFIGFVLRARARVAPGAGLAAGRGGRGQQTLELFAAAVREVAALRAVERVAERREGRRRALGLAQGTPRIQAWNVTR